MPFGEPVEASSPAIYNLSCHHTLDTTISINLQLYTGDSGGTVEESDTIFQELVDLFSSKTEITDLVASKGISGSQNIEVTPTEEPA